MEKRGISTSSVATVRDRIIDHIKGSGLNPGERIATERGLQEKLGISRSRVRDALAALEAEGVITRRVGSGAYLAQDLNIANSSFTTITADELSPARMMEARMTLELSMIPIIVSNATNNDINALRSVLEAGEAARTSAEFEMRDTEFHYLLAASTHNDLLSKFAEMIVEARRGTQWGRAKKRTSTQRNVRTYQRDHRRILQAISNRDSAKAVAAMKKHLVTIRDKLIGT